LCWAGLLTFQHPEGKRTLSPELEPLEKVIQILFLSSLSSRPPSFSLGDFPWFIDGLSEEEASPHQRASGEGHHLKSKRPNPCAYTPPSLKAVQRIAESHLQSISNLNENQASEEEDELGELRELGYPREEDEEEEDDDDEEEEEEEDSQAEVLKGCRGPAGQKTACGQGLEGPWERPPPLDEPQRDGSSKEQVEDPALNGEARWWRMGSRGWDFFYGRGQALSPSACLAEPGEEPQRPAHPEPGT
uniref:Protein phosphatase 1 regulatory subunit 1B n=1 Tax=Ailuropoda melanoleuca TaxID=9646 RepID=A0A7N5P8S6_AILME